MLEAATVAFENLLVPTRLGYLFIGVVMGLALGAIPGLGGLVGLAILLPSLSTWILSRPLPS